MTKKQRLETRIMIKSFVMLMCFGMLFTGTINTLLNKMQDLSCVSNCDNIDPKQRRYYEQPIWQTLNMFFGEAACLLVYYISLFKKSQSYQLIPDASAADDDDNLDTSLEDSFVISPTEIPAPLMSGWSHLLFIFPTLCDITGTVFKNLTLIKDFNEYWTTVYFCFNLSNA